MPESVQSVTRALNLVEHLSGTDSDLSLTELARLAELQPPTAHRLLQTLVERQWVVQDPSTTRYRLSHRLLGIVGDLEARTGRLRALVRPHLEALRDLSGESTNLVLLDGLATVYIDQVPGRRPIRMFTEIGARVPAYASGAGKAMLAFAPSGAQRALTRTPLKQLTEHTVTDLATLQREFEQIRTVGYACDNEEYEIGVACVAAPILAGDDAAPAAISISAPAARWKSVDRDALGRQLADHAAQISGQLGHAGGSAGASVHG